MRRGHGLYSEKLQCKQQIEYTARWEIVKARGEGLHGSQSGICTEGW